MKTMVKLKELSQWFKKRKTALAVVLTIFASLIMSTNALIAKLLLVNELATTNFIVMSRLFFMGCFVMPLVSYKKTGFFTSPLLLPNKWLLLLRCTSGCLGFLAFFAALDRLPLAESGIVFQAVTPIITSLLSVLVLKDKFRYWDILLFVLTTTGVFLILHPPALFEQEPKTEDDVIPFHDRLIGIGFAVFGGVTWAVTAMTMRLLKNVDGCYIIWCFAIVGTIVTSVVNVTSGTLAMPPTYLARAAIVLTGSWAVLVQLCFIFAARNLHLPVISLIRSSQLAILFFYQIMFFDIIPSKLSLIGSAIVALALLLLISRAFLIDTLKRSENKTDESLFAPNGKYHSFFLCLTM